MRKKEENGHLHAATGGVLAAIRVEMGELRGLLELADDRDRLVLLLAVIRIPREGTAAEEMTYILKNGQKRRITAPRFAFA